MQEPIFQIRNMQCRYPRAKHVCLNIQELNLYAKDTTFIIGASGCGKSTLLETIGLMNQTVQHSEELQFNYTQNGNTTDLKSFWEWNRKDQSRFRSSELGFIFQSTHLFNSLSVWDNVKLPALDDNTPEEEIDSRLNHLFDRMLKGVEKDKSGAAISGGQRQRLAFIRAFCAPHQVLLADEPTGNLDPGNANLLLEEVRLNAAAGKTAILVSHDIRLALQYADRIILLTRDNTLPGRPGAHLPELDFRREEEHGLWMTDHMQHSTSELQALIERHFVEEAQLQSKT